MGFDAPVDGQAAVVAVEAGLCAVGWNKARREHFEVIGSLGACAASEDVVRVLGANPCVAGIRISALRRIAWRESRRRRRVLVGNPSRPVIAVATPIATIALAFAAC